MFMKRSSLFVRPFDSLLMIVKISKLGNTFSEKSTQIKHDARRVFARISAGFRLVKTSAKKPPARDFHTENVNEWKEIRARRQPYYIR